eukprot:Nk52_evm24s1737 gene=Nk52_evmTU24s1737
MNKMSIKYTCSLLGMRSLFGTTQPKSILNALTSYYSTDNNAIRRTPLYDFHVENNGQMVDFEGWLLPVNYKGLSIGDSVKHTRSKASLFDVSHMLQFKLHGNDREEFIEKLVVGDIKGLKPDTGTLSLIVNENGGIKDDCVINKVAKNPSHLYVVSNAGCDKKDIAHFKKHLEKFVKSGGDCEMELLPGRGLLALQGPKACDVLKSLVDDKTKNVLGSLQFMSGSTMTIADLDDCRVTRCGYTGEDGFEISVNSSDTRTLAEAILGHSEVKLAGLAARDALRLEAGLCLYGHDINEETTPMEAGLKWTIGKSRLANGGFLGFDSINQKIAEGLTVRRVGIVIQKGAPAREGAEVYDSESKEVVGKITSGIPSPTLGKNIAMAYVKTGFHKKGTPLTVKVRKSFLECEVTKMPFVTTNYFKG